MLKTLKAFHKQAVQIVNEKIYKSFEEAQEVSFKFDWSLVECENKIGYRNIA